MRPIPLALLSFLAGLLLLPLAVCLYLAFGHPPVATADKPFPFEARIAHLPLRARIAREMPVRSPIPATDENLIAGASLYEDKCESCHGTADQPSALGRSTFPRAPQLWIRRANGTVGVSDDPVGETYWKVRNGIRLTAMPAYGSSLSEKQLWQVSLLLSLAAKPLPAEAARTVGR
jgi:mono/diheme cytochrome c family protein